MLRNRINESWLPESRLKDQNCLTENQYARPGLRRFEIRVYGLLISSNGRSAARRRCARALDEHICVSGFGRPGPASAVGCTSACRTQGTGNVRPYRGKEAGRPLQGCVHRIARPALGRNRRRIRPANQRRKKRSQRRLESDSLLRRMPSERINIARAGELEVCGQPRSWRRQREPIENPGNCRLADHDGRGGDHRRRLAGDARPLAQVAGPFVLQQPEAIEDGI